MCNFGTLGSSVVKNSFLFGASLSGCLCLLVGFSTPWTFSRTGASTSCCLWYLIYIPRQLNSYLSCFFWGEGWEDLQFQVWASMQIFVKEVFCCCSFIFIVVFALRKPIQDWINVLNQIQKLKGPFFLLPLYTIINYFRVDNEVQIMETAKFLQSGLEWCLYIKTLMMYLDFIFLPTLRWHETPIKLHR